MKWVTIFLLLFPLFSLSQKKSGGYAYLQPAFYINQKFNNRFGINAGAGFTPSKYIGFGGGFTAYVFKENSQFATLYADIRPFFSSLEKPIAYFVSIEPGYVIYNKSLRISNITYKSQGRAAVDILVGMIGSPADAKSIGMTINFGYSLLSFETNNVTSTYHGFKIQGGVAF
jgi:hypothetical protein